MKKYCGFCKYIVLNSMICLCLIGCKYPPFSWSPDGKRVAFIGPDDERLWIWDTQNGKATRHARNPDEPVKYCQWLLLDDDILLGTGSKNESEMKFYKLDIQSDAVYEIADGVEMFTFTVSDDGRYLYYAKEISEDEKRYEFYEKDIAHPDTERALFQCKEQITFPAIDSSRSRILFSVESKKIYLYEMGQDSPRVLLSDEELGFYWPTWIDDETILFTAATDENSDVGTLYVYSLKERTRREIGRNVYTLGQPSFNPNHRLVAVTMDTENLQEEQRRAAISTDQTAIIELASGKIVHLTENPFGNVFAIFSPVDNRLLYQSPTEAEDGEGMYHILDPDTKQDMMIWRDDEERLFSTAENFMAKGEFILSLATFKDLLSRFPDTRLKKFIDYNLVEISLLPETEDADLVFASLKELPQNLRSSAETMIWRDEDRLAEDPAEDWLVRYGTDASHEAFQFNTDAPRDLLGLSIRNGEKKLYLKIDYNSDRDLSGLTLQDTLLLFDYNSPNEGEKQITPTMQWERGAERQIRIGHWFQQGNNSQYDVKIMNEKRDVISHYSASGFANPDYPYFDVVSVNNENQGSIVIGLSKEILNLPEELIFVQVCTAKGGLEEFQKLEKTLAEAGRCDIADTFGEANTAERIHNEETNDKPGRIAGYACVLDLSK